MVIIVDVVVVLGRAVVIVALVIVVIVMVAVFKIPTIREEISCSIGSGRGRSSSVAANFQDSGCLYVSADLLWG